MLAVGKHLILARKKSASAIDHVDAREAVLAGDLLRSGWGVYARGGGLSYARAGGTIIYMRERTPTARILYLDAIKSWNGMK